MSWSELWGALRRWWLPALRQENERLRQHIDVLADILHEQQRM